MFHILKQYVKLQFCVFYSIGFYAVYEKVNDSEIDDSNHSRSSDIRTLILCSLQRYAECNVDVCAFNW